MEMALAAGAALGGSSTFAVASTAFSALTSIIGGINQDKAAKASAAGMNVQAEQMRINAGQERAAGQRRALEEGRAKDRAISKNIAGAAAGGGTLDGSVMDIIGDLEAEGYYNQEMQRYQSEDRARGLETDANFKNYEAQLTRNAGKSAKRLGFMKAAGSIFSGMSGMYERYGGIEDFGQSSGGGGVRLPQRKPSYG